MFTAIQEFFFNIRTQKLRAFLTMFGIVWGRFCYRRAAGIWRGLQKFIYANTKICTVWGANCRRLRLTDNQILRRIQYRRTGGRLHEEDARMLSSAYQPLP